MSAPPRPLLPLLLLLLAGCSLRAAAPAVDPAAPAAPQERPIEPIRITLVATNDHHGWAHPHSARMRDGTEVTQGGLAALASYVRILREQNPGGVLLLDGGDMFQGTLAANLTEGEVVIEAMNRLGYTAAALGNHEFDYGPVGPSPVATEPGMDPFGAIKARIAQANFPMLAVNIYEAQTGRRPAWLSGDGTMIVEANGVRVGLIGLITPTTPQVTNPVNVASLRFGSLAPEAELAARRLRERGAQVVVALAHAGGKCATAADPRDLGGCDVDTGEIFEMLAELPERTLDAVIAGHTHSTIGHFVRGTPVIETHGLGRALGVIELFYDPQRRRLMEERTTIRAGIPICTRTDAGGGCDLKKLAKLTAGDLLPASFEGRPISPDPEVERAIAPALAKVAWEQARSLGLHVPKALTRSYEAESPLGTFLADSLREMERADVALLNSGGLRADLPAGEVTYGHVYEVIPFENTLATLTVTGEELRRLLYAAYGARKGVFQVSGLEVQLSTCPGKGRLQGFTLSDGRPVQPKRMYRVVLPDFLARGGDGLASVMVSLPANRVDLGGARPLNFREALIDYWQRQGAPLVSRRLGRVAFVKDDAACSAGAQLDLHSQ